MCMQTFAIIHAIRLENGVTHSERLERDLGLNPVNITEDDRRNLPDIYRELFGAKCESFFSYLWSNLI